MFCCAVTVTLLVSSDHLLAIQGRKESGEIFDIGVRQRSYHGLHHRVVARSAFVSLYGFDQVLVLLAGEIRIVRRYADAVLTMTGDAGLLEDGTAGSRADCEAPTGPKRTGRKASRQERSR